ncbi:type II secretory pathway pseudopilin PulG [Litorivivens lipolytica]|uniref:Type II secretory pathway pseudopilin PulG n=1 Tax=Litorivivens lipolytica TaxID=1524264 RepID=A0A7W4Z5H1_9GAMM|nr:pilus assembly PilX N-terminal domain-containing protein [Litorivivens lipolytica]MBB3047509.1 type II secretory pathway pseudopilin PulG [Litorivivens lipolytica]
MISRNQQQGAILVIVLVMVGIFMIIVTSLVSSSNINFRIAGNQQYRMEAKLAARNGMEAYISNPANFTLPLPINAEEIGTDFDGDGTDDLIASVAPPNCTRSTIITIPELDVSNPSEAQCLGSGSLATTGIFGGSGGVTSGNSWCSRMNWDVASTVNNANTGAGIEMHQGVYMLAVVGTSCP